MFALKAGVRVRGVQAEMILALLVIADVMREVGAPLTITSMTDGQHMPGSLHYCGLAVDLRLTPPHTDQIFNLLRARLTSDFDVVLEIDHIHVEYDPN